MCEFHHGTRTGFAIKTTDFPLREFPTLPAFFYLSTISLYYTKELYYDEGSRINPAWRLERKHEATSDE